MRCRPISPSPGAAHEYRAAVHVDPKNIVAQGRFNELLKQGADPDRRSGYGGRAPSTDSGGGARSVGGSSSAQRFGSSSKQRQAATAQNNTTGGSRSGARGAYNPSYF